MSRRYELEIDVQTTVVIEADCLDEALDEVMGGVGVFFGGDVDITLEGQELVGVLVDGKRMEKPFEEARE